jgi:hypothetical protein
MAVEETGLAAEGEGEASGSALSSECGEMLLDILWLVGASGRSDISPICGFESTGRDGRAVRVAASRNAPGNLSWDGPSLILMGRCSLKPRVVIK